jgi:hypothetical protein
VNSRLILTGLAALLAVAACGGPVNGQAQPGTDTTANSNPTSTPTSEGHASLDDVDPCTLLTRDEAEQVAGPLREEPTLDDIGSARGCEFKPQRMRVVVDIRTNAGIADVQAPGEVADVNVGDRKAKQFIGTTGSCVVVMGVTVSSRVDVTVTASTDADPCAVAKPIAELVEPRLP